VTGIDAALFPWVKIKSAGSLSPGCSAMVHKAKYQIRLEALSSPAICAATGARRELRLQPVQMQSLMMVCADSSASVTSVMGMIHFWSISRVGVQPQDPSYRAAEVRLTSNAKLPVISASHPLGLRVRSRHQHAQVDAGSQIHTYSARQSVALPVAEANKPESIWRLEGETIHKLWLAFITFCPR